MTTGREVVMGRIRRALDGPRGTGLRAAAEIVREYRLEGDLDDGERVELFADRVGEYRAAVHRCTVDDVASTVGRLCDSLDARRLIAPPDLPDAWHPEGVEVVADAGQSPRELDALDGVITGCAVAIAETGTIVLDGAAAQGRRALTLVPDLHVCVVRTGQIVELVPEAVRALRAAVVAGRPLTFVSGPSATSDIELSRVEGVHGPRNLHVVLAE